MEGPAVPPVPRPVSEGCTLALREGGPDDSWNARAAAREDAHAIPRDIRREGRDDGFAQHSGRRYPDDSFVRPVVEAAAADGCEVAPEVRRDDAREPFGVPANP